MCRVQRDGLDPGFLQGSKGSAAAEREIALHSLSQGKALALSRRWVGAVTGLSSKKSYVIIKFFAG